MPRVRGSGQPVEVVDRGWWFSQTALRCLERTPPARVTSIAAPAGSGKSRLVQHWLARSRSRPWIWVDVVPADREPGIDLERIEGLGELPPESGVLVVAGLELLSAQQQTLLIERLPAGLRVILLSTGLGLPAGCRVRLAGELAELSRAQLWWPPAVIGARLHRLTGGWPAGVIILGRGVDGRDLASRAVGGGLSGGDGAAAGGLADDGLADDGLADDDDPAEAPTVRLARDPGVLDFVTEQVLDRLAPALRRFVLHTSVLDRLDPALCEVLAPQAGAHAMLAEAHRQGLTEQHASYSPVIQAAACRALRSEQPGAERHLLRRAGEYAREQGDHPAAAACLVRAGDWERVLAVLQASAPTGFRGWSPTALHDVVTRLPGAGYGADAGHRALIAFAAAISGDHLLSAEVIHQTPTALTQAVPWWRALTGTVLALCPGTPDAVKDVTALDQQIAVPPILGSTDHAGLIAAAHLLAARSALFDGDLDGVRWQLDAGWAAESTRIPQYAVLAGLGADALASAWSGSLAAAQRRADRARRLAAQAGLENHPMVGPTLLAGAEVLRAQGRSTEALAELDAIGPRLHGLEQFVAAASGGRPLTTAERILRAHLLLDRADQVSAAAELDLLATDGDDRLPIGLAAALAVARARLYLSRDDVMAADRVLAQAPLTGPVAATRVTAALQRQASEEAATVMRNWPYGPGHDAPDNRLRFLLAAAGIDLATDRRPEAGRGVEEALAVAEPEGHVQVFLEAVPAVRVLTAVVLRRSRPGSSWRQELAGRLDEIRLVTDSGSVPVTRRELAVLEQLTTSLTHAQIAAGMFVSENTLKSHCRNLYRKLGVNSRADAVRAARARGWLGSSLGEVVVEVNITPEPVVVEL